MSFRDVLRSCSYTGGPIVVNVRPMNHLDKLAKHLNDKGEISGVLTECTHPNKHNDYCGSDCPKMKGKI